MGQMGIVSGLFTTVVYLKVTQKNKNSFVHSHNTHFGYNFKNSDSEAILFISPLMESREQQTHL